MGSRLPSRVLTSSTSAASRRVPEPRRSSAEEERRRTEPVVRRLAEAGHTVSIDTSKAEVAEAALDAGARIVNDVTAFRADPGWRRFAPSVAATWF